MNHSWKAVGQHLEKGGTLTPAVTSHGEVLTTKKETCKAIAEHAKNLVKKKNEQIMVKGIRV